MEKISIAHIPGQSGIKIASLLADIPHAVLVKRKGVDPKIVAGRRFSGTANKLHSLRESTTRSPRRE